MFDLMRTERHTDAILASAIRDYWHGDYRRPSVQDVMKEVDGEVRGRSEAMLTSGPTGYDDLFCIYAKGDPTDLEVWNASDGRFLSPETDKAAYDHAEVEIMRELGMEEEAGEHPSVTVPHPATL